VALVQQAHSRAAEILTSGETIEYVAVANRGSLTHAPDVAVASNKRIMLFRKKVLGKLEQDDFHWRDVRNATTKDGRNGVTLTLDSIQGWQMAIESLPKGQAWRLYELAVEHCDRLAQMLRGRTGPIDPAFGIPGGAAAPVPAAAPEVPPSYYAAPSPAVPQLPALPSVSQQHPDRTSIHIAESTAMPSSEPAQAHPTPESVLQAILQQAAQAGGAPTRPMPLSAAAFQAPVADAQPVTFSEPGTNLNMRSMPRLNSLEQISVFSGPLTGSLPSIGDGPRHSPYEQRSVERDNVADAYKINGATDRQEVHGETENSPEQRITGRAHGENDAEHPDGLMPLPGSHSSGPLLEAAYDYGGSVYAEDMISGSLETQQLNTNRAADLADRNTSTHLSGGGEDRVQVAGRSRRPSAASRTPAPMSQKSRQSGMSQAPRAHGRFDADDPVQKMKQLKAMLDAGLIDNADYESKKAEILSRL
jgi:hypothetical protein